MLERARALHAQLTNVKWIHGDGESLSGIADASVDAVFSHVVFQHIPDPRITLGYVREMGRVLRPGGWTAFQVSTDPRCISNGVPPPSACLPWWDARRAVRSTARGAGRL